MGTFTGHAVPAIFFFVFGIWHLLASCSNYLKSPREYCARAWQPVSFASGKLRCLELYILVIMIPLGVFYELGISTGFSPMENDMIASYRINSFQHSSMLFTFWLFALFLLVSESTSLLPLPMEFPFVLSGVAFLVEFTVIGQEAAQNSGLEGKCDFLLACVVGVCSVCQFLLAFQPRAFFVEFVYSMALTFQGTWLFQISISLYVDRFLPFGCNRLLGLPGGISGSTQCDLEESKVRAMGLMSFIFNCHIGFILLLSMSALGIVAKVQGYRRGGYDLTLESDFEPLQMKPLSKLSFDKR